MATPYIGEIRLFAFGFRGAPIGWQTCDGSLLPISEYDALFALIGTTYGGDGQTTFAVPDLRGRVPLHQGTGPGLSSHVIGELAGTEALTLTLAQTPAHAHSLPVNFAAGTSTSPANAVPAAVSSGPLYAAAAPAVDMHPAAIGLSGSSQPHDNLMPTLAVQFAIATEGIFPQQA